MSLSKVARKCEFCKVGKGIFTCPKCSQKYCSLHCYKSREHEECSESFYKEWVEQSLQGKSCRPGDRENMMHILKRFEEESSVEDSAISELCIEDRFAGLNINNIDENEIWENLNEEERAKFEALIQDEKELDTIVSIKQPWWMMKNLNLVMEFDSVEPDANDEYAARPAYPLNCKKLSEVTSVKPSNCIQFNLVNILYSYAFLCRFYNCDLRDCLEDVVKYLFIFSPVLSEGRNYCSLEESLQDSIRAITQSDLDIPMSFAKSIVSDIGNITNGPDNAKPSTFVLCALQDIEVLFLELKQTLQRQSGEDKSLRKKLLLAIKKVEYFMCWSVEFESSLKDMASDLVLIMLPDLIPDVHTASEEQNVVCEQKAKPIIEEIE